MKNFFEFLGFVSTALLSGFLVFTYIGHKKNADQADSTTMTSAYNSGEQADLPQLQNVSNSRAGVSKEKKKAVKGADFQMEKKTLAVESASVTEKLKDLYNDADFVATIAKKWKKQVAEASETHSVKPHLMLSNVVVKSYLGNYSARDFSRDVSEHAGDLALPNNAALKSYDYSWSVGKVAQQYNLAKYFPAPAPVAVAKAPALKASVASKKTAAAPQQKAKPAAVAPAEAGFREMVAKEEGFSSWQGLQRLGDPETKKNAERRVKTLMSAARVK